MNIREEAETRYPAGDPVSLVKLAEQSAFVAGAEWARKEAEARLVEAEAVIERVRDWNTLTNGRPRYRECDDIVSGATCWWADVDGGGSWFPHDFYDGACVNCFRREEDLSSPSVVLADRDKEVAARAWDEGLDAGRDRWMDAREFGDKPVNPYRSGSEGGTHG